MKVFKATYIFGNEPVEGVLIKRFLRKPIFCCSDKFTKWHYRTITKADKQRFWYRREPQLALRNVVEPTCDECGTKLTLDDKFCPHCSAKTKFRTRVPKEYCSVCGELAYCENYCSKCGTKLKNE